MKDTNIKQKQCSKRLSATIHGLYSCIFLSPLLLLNLCCILPCILDMFYDVSSSYSCTYAWAPRDYEKQHEDLFFHLATHYSISWSPVTTVGSAIYHYIFYKYGFLKYLRETNMSTCPIMWPLGGKSPNKKYHRHTSTPSFSSTPGLLGACWHHRRKGPSTSRADLLHVGICGKARLRIDIHIKIPQDVAQEILATQIWFVFWQCFVHLVMKLCMFLVNVWKNCDSWSCS